MTVKRGGLGRNLSALLQTHEPVVPREQTNTPAAVSSSNLVFLSIDTLQPGRYQPRGVMNDTSIAELAESIKKQGLLQPLIVRAIAPQRYEIVAGERRWRACKLASLETIPVIVKTVDDETAMAMALVENIQREALNAMDEARAMYRLVNEFSLTHQEVAHLLSKSRAAVSNALRLLNLTPEVQNLVEIGALDMGHARCLLMLSEEKQLEVAQFIHQKRLSVREAEALVARLNAKQSKSKEALFSPTALFKEELSFLADKLQTRINIRQGKAGNGTLVIHYADVERLKRMIQHLSTQEIE